MKNVAEFSNIVSDIAMINELAKSNPTAFVQRCEQDYMIQLKKTCDLVMEDLARYSLLLLAGPSSSGKTTTAYKLSGLFKERGIEASVISLDDFFLGKSQYPLLSDGKPDMESVNALDVELINRCFSDLVSKGEALFPQFDFATSSRKPLGTKVTLGPRDLLIVEGLHALNPVLVRELRTECIFKIYVSTRTKFMEGDKEILTPKDTRLIRRMVRDHNFRGHSPLSTLAMWDEVLAGEKIYIYPYRDAVDIKIDSTLDYEPCVFHYHILPFIEGLKNEPFVGGKFSEIVRVLEKFCDLDKDLVPVDSHLREFIGSN